jgi:hypothetical protein
MICSHGNIKSIKAKYEYSLQIVRQQGHYKKRLHKADPNENGLPLHIPSGTGAVVDLHIEL